MLLLRLTMFIAALAASIHTAHLAADDAVVNTPTAIAALTGEWELQPAAKDAYKERLSFDGSSGGQWRQSKPTLPVSITFYVEGHELLIQHYYQPGEAFNYRLKQLRFAYKLDGDSLTLARDGVTQIWKHLAEAKSK